MSTNFSHSFDFCGNAIEATVTNKASVIHEWLKEVGCIYHDYLHPRIIVGLDCEFVPNHVKGVPNRAATLQLCIGNKCLLVQLLYLDYIPQSLRNFFNDPNIVFVGAEVDKDVKLLTTDFGLGFASTTADVQDIAMQSWPVLFQKRPSLKALAQHFLGLSMSKPPHIFHRFWHARLLWREKVEYACTDAYASYRIGRKLLTMDHTDMN